MKKNISFKFLYLITFLLFTSSCSTTDPPPDETKPTLTLALDDASCTEAWLQLTTKDLTLPEELTLKQFNPNGDSVTQTFSLNSADSLLYIDSLLPNQIYSFQVSCIQNPVSSNKLTTTTLDTTSHNFTWQTFEFGQHSSSVLYDVAIINENDIWAVGEIYMNDSLGNPDPISYNAVHWNGQSWELKRIKTNACGGVDYPPIKAIFAFSSNDILFAHIDGSISNFNGIEFTNDCSLITQLNGSANKIWGRSRNDFYVVSAIGFIAYYQNGSWKKIESGTNLDIYDILGDYSVKENKLDILAVAAKRAVNFEKKILRISGPAIVSLPVLGIPYSIQAIWFSGKNHYVVGSGLFRKYDINSTQSWKALHPGITNYHLNDISANGLNDIIICGDFGELLHFNGVTWKSYQESFSGILLGEIAMKDNLFVTVGYSSNKAFIAVGNRY